MEQVHNLCVELRATGLFPVAMPEVYAREEQIGSGDCANAEEQEPNGLVEFLGPDPDVVVVVPG